MFKQKMKYFFSTTTATFFGIMFRHAKHMIKFRERLWSWLKIEKVKS